MKSKSLINKKQTSDWASNLRNLIKPVADEIPPGFLTTDQLEREWKISRVQIRRMMRVGIEQGLIERRFVRLMTPEGWLRRAPIFGQKGKAFDVSNISK